MGRVQGVGMRGMGVMSSRLVMAGGVVPGGFLVVLRSVLVMLRGLGMKGLRRVAVRLFFWHKYSPLLVYLNSTEVVRFPDKALFVA